MFLCVQREALYTGLGVLKLAVTGSITLEQHFTLN